MNVPDVEDIKPTVYLDNFKARQKYRLVVFGEKTSLADVVRRSAIDIALISTCPAARSRIRSFTPWRRPVPRTGGR